MKTIEDIRQWLQNQNNISDKVWMFCNMRNQPHRYHYVYTPSAHSIDIEHVIDIDHTLSKVRTVMTAPYDLGVLWLEQTSDLFGRTDLLYRGTVFFAGKDCIIPYLDTEDCFRWFGEHLLQVQDISIPTLTGEECQDRLKIVLAAVCRYIEQAAGAPLESIAAAELF